MTSSAFSVLRHLKQGLTGIDLVRNHVFEALSVTPWCLCVCEEHWEGGVCWELPEGEHPVYEAPGLRHGLLVQRPAKGFVPQARGKPYSPCPAHRPFHLLWAPNKLLERGKWGWLDHKLNWCLFVLSGLLRSSWSSSGTSEPFMNVLEGRLSRGPLKHWWLCSESVTHCECHVQLYCRRVKQVCTFLEMHIFLYLQDVSPVCP